MMPSLLLRNAKVVVTSDAARRDVPAAACIRTGRP